MQWGMVAPRVDPSSCGAASKDREEVKGTGGLAQTKHPTALREVCLGNLLQSEL